MRRRAGLDSKEPTLEGVVDDLVLEVQKRFKEAREFWNDWRKEARECYDLVAGHQWDEHALTILERQKRPPIKFNRIGPVLDSVCGSKPKIGRK